MTEHLAWYLARAAGIVSWGLLTATMLWGLAHAMRVGGRGRQWWVLGVHRFLGVLSVVFVVVHVVAIVADGYTSFGPADVLVPFGSRWRPIPVALGIVALYVLAAIEVTSLLQGRLPRSWWRHLHLASYGVLVLASLHALSAGTDVGAVLAGGVAVGVGTVVVLLGALGWVVRSEARPVASADVPSRAPSR